MTKINVKNKIKKNNPTAILTADWHLRLNSPVCRIDNFEEKQWEKVIYISNLQKKYQCEVWHAGDLFEFWKPSPLLLSKTIEYLPKGFKTIYGNHDLPQHNLELAYKSGIATLEAAEVLDVIECCHWDAKPSTASFQYKTKDILMWHVMTYANNNPWPGNIDTPARGLIRKYNYDLMLTGHNHRTFVEEYKGRLLVNPGSITRQSADQVNHKPCVFLYWQETNKIEKVYLPIEEKNVISRQHIEETEKRNERISAFVEQLDKGEWKKELNFTKSLENFEKANNIDKKIMNIVYKSF